VIGHDRPAVLRAARRAGAIAAAARGLAAAAARADAIVLAAPPRANLRLLRRLAGRARAGLVVTDVGGVKSPICAEAARLRLRRFVGGHPMAGAERSGFGSGRADLFAGRAWVLTPAAATDAAAVRLVARLARAAGARPRLMGAREHDRAVAYLSHLPQLAAWALRATAEGDRAAARHLDAAGPGFQDMTRLARSPRRLWREILEQNAPEVRRAVAALRRALARPLP
jgi:prephenate dehydrogenase